MQVISYPTGHSFLSACHHKGSYYLLTANCGKHGTMHGATTAILHKDFAPIANIDIPNISHYYHESLIQEVYGAQPLIHDMLDNSVWNETKLAVSFNAPSFRHDMIDAKATYLKNGKEFLLTKEPYYNDGGRGFGWHTKYIYPTCILQEYKCDQSRSVSTDTHAVMTSPEALKVGEVLFGPTKFKMIQETPGIKKGHVVLYRRGGDFRVMCPSKKDHPKHLVIASDSLTVLACCKNASYLIDLDI